MGVAAAVSVVGGMMQGQAAKEQGDAEGRFLGQQADQEKLAQLRDLDALDAESSRTMARSRAVLAAGGGDTTDGTALGLLTHQAGQFGEKRKALLNDSDARIAGLYDRANSARSAGSSAQLGAIFGGLGKGASAASSLFDYSRAPRSVPKGAGAKPSFG